MSSVLKQILNELDRLTPEEQWQVMGHLMNQLQHRAIVIAKPDQLLSDSADSVSGSDVGASEEWDEQIANDLETGKLNHLIAKAEADIKANQVRDLDEVLHNF